MGNRKTLDDMARYSSKPKVEQPIETPDNTALSSQEDTPVEPQVEAAPQDAQQEVVPTVQDQPKAVTELPPPIVQASGYPRIDLLKAKLTEFKTAFPTNAAMSPIQTAAMVRHIEMCINILISTTTYSETFMALSELRSAFFKNENNVFNKARILGNMIEPRTGRPIVSNHRIMTLTSLIYITMNPKTFEAQKGRIDVASSVVGLPEQVAANIIQYYS